MTLGLRIALGLALVGILAFSPACGGSSSSDGGSEPGQCADPFSTSLSGTWFVLERSTSETGGCGFEPRTSSPLCNQSADGSQLTFIGRTTFTATLCGSRATADFVFSVPEISGIRRYNSLLLQFSSPTAFTGSANWTFTSSAGTTCTGSSTFEGSR